MSNGYHLCENRKLWEMEGSRKKRKAEPARSYDECIIVQVAASQLTSSKLWSMLNPIEERQSKLPSPSTCVSLAEC